MLAGLFLAPSEYYPFAENIGTNLADLETENDYGAGSNIKLFFALQNPQYGTLAFGTCSYFLYIIPRNKPDSKGVEFFNLSYLEYSYAFTKNFSLFANSALYLKSGRSDRTTDIVSVATRMILGVKWTFLDKGGQ
jgi:hypothetical protein